MKGREVRGGEVVLATASPRRDIESYAGRA